MDVRVGLQRKLSSEELMLLNCGVGEDSWESLEGTRSDRVPDELWTKVHDTVQETGIKTIPKKKKCKKAKWLSEEALQTAVKRREVKSKWEKERYIHLNAEFQRIAKRDNKTFLSDQYKIEENNRMGKTGDLFKKIRDTKGTFHAKMGSLKDRNGRDLTEAEDIKKRWQEYIEELYKKDLHDPDNQDGVITYLEPDILDVKSSGPQKSLRTKLVEVMEFQLSYFIFFPIFISWRLIPLQYCSGFCQTLTWISHGFTCVPVELFQILKDDAVKLLHSICQQIWKTQQWPQE